jgi:hypothetical protein
MDLLHRHIGRDSKVVTLALTNPFSFALGLEPPKGSPLWWDLGVSHSESHYPAPEAVFGDADFVIFPLVQPEDKGCCKETLQGILQEYAPYLGQHYAEVERTPHWLLLKRSVRQG